MSHVLLVHASARPHTHTHTHTHTCALLMPSALPMPSQNLDALWPHWPYSPYLTSSDFHLLASLKDSLWGYHCVGDKALQCAMCYLLQRNESSSYWVVIIAAVRRVKEECWERWRLYWEEVIMHLAVLQWSSVKFVWDKKNRCNCFVLTLLNHILLAVQHTVIGSYIQRALMGVSFFFFHSFWYERNKMFVWTFLND